MAAMADLDGRELLDALLGSWDRNNTILVNFLGAVPESGLAARAAPDSPTVGSLFAHIHYVRLMFVTEDVPEVAPGPPPEEWPSELDAQTLAQMLNDSAKVVRDAVESRVVAGRGMDLHYDHPILMLQHMIWHEGYHHGQIKIALKNAGVPMSDKVAGPLTWRVWMNKTA